MGFGPDANYRLVLRRDVVIGRLLGSYKFRITRVCQVSLQQFFVTTLFH